MRARDGRQGQKETQSVDTCNRKGSMRFTIDSSHLVISLSTPKSHVTLMPGQKPSVIMTSSEIGLFLGAVTANSPTWRASKEERGGGGARGERYTKFKFAHLLKYIRTASHAGCEHTCDVRATAREEGAGGRDAQNVLYIVQVVYNPLDSAPRSNSGRRTIPTFCSWTSRIAHCTCECTMCL